MRRPSEERAMLNTLLVAMREWWFVILFLVVALSADWLKPYDDTDDAAKGERSGMALYTDNLTGCQYLKASFFAELTPRVDGDGKHVGCN
ncbi:MAG: hypothetical protein GY938_29165 [Ketobacter sp.]|nr:hypothetical protein [Ketobacter sp.]